MKSSKLFVMSPRSYGSFLRRFLDHAEPQDSVRGPTQEIVDGKVILRDVRDRLVQHPARKMNLGFAVAEFISFMVAIVDIDFFKLFIHDYDRYSSDGETLDGAYGARMIVETAFGLRSQLPEIIEQLRQNPLSRRAVLSIYEGGDLYGYGGVNTPCTLTMQFLARDDALQGIVTMRSSDVYLGLTYDLFVFSMVLETIARAVGMEAGAVFLNAGSLHMYDEHVDLVDDLEGRPSHALMKAMPAGDPLPAIGSLGQLAELLTSTTAEDYVDAIDATFGADPDPMGVYFRDLALVMGAYAYRDNKKASSGMMMSIDDPALRRVSRFRLSPISRKRAKEDANE